MKKKMLILTALLAIAAITYATHSIEMLGITTAMAYTLVSVTKPSKGVGAPGKKKDRIVIFSWDDVSTYNRVADQALVDGNIVMKAGKYMVEIYGSLNTISPSYSTEGDPDARGLLHALAFTHPGEEQEIMDFIQNHMNENLGVIVQKCGTRKNKQYGSPCAPLQIVPTGVDDDSQLGQQISLEAVTRTDFLPATYEGTITLPSPLATIAADDTTPSVSTGSGQYQLQDNTIATAITTLDDAVHDGVYTLLGSGGSNPSSIASGGDFALKDGATWNAITGSQITFKAFKSGANAFTFVELSRS